MGADRREASADGSQVVTWALELHGGGCPRAGQPRDLSDVWVRQKDGSWKWSHDIGNADRAQTLICKGCSCGSFPARVVVIHASPPEPFP
jgi:hypothetical protein